MRFRTDAVPLRAESRFLCLFWLGPVFSHGGIASLRDVGASCVRPTIGARTPILPICRKLGKYKERGDHALNVRDNNGRVEASVQGPINTPRPPTRPDGPLSAPGRREQRICLAHAGSIEITATSSHRRAHGSLGTLGKLAKRTGHCRGKCVSKRCRTPANG